MAPAAQWRAVAPVAEWRASPPVEPSQAPAPAAGLTNPPRAPVAALAVLMAAAGTWLLAGAQGSSGAPLALSVVDGPAPFSAPSPAPAPEGSVVSAAPPAAPVDTSSSTTAATAPTTTTATAPTTATATPTAPVAPPAATIPAPPATGPARTAAGAAAKSGPPPTGRPAATTTTQPAADPDAQLRQVEAIADTSGWDWRSVHVHFKIGFDPEACCHWGVYDPTDHKTIWIGPTAFGDATRIRYVVLHELAHAWQWHSHRLKKLEADMAPWGYADINALEAGADCIAADWGAAVTSGHYWACQPDALTLMSQRLAGVWK